MRTELAGVRYLKRMEMMPERVVSWKCPAKINLYLAVLGQRDDGYHSLLSLVAPLEFGDTLEVRVGDSASPDRYSCNDETLAWNEDNLVHLALERYRTCSGFKVPLVIRLEKRIPTGAGFGGGSSDAAGMLECLNRLNPAPLPGYALRELAESIGSDCPLFLERTVVRMEGRGEQLSGLPEAMKKRWSGSEVLLFHPGFAVSTPWAYQELRKSGASAYCDAQRAEDEFAQCLESWEGWERSTRNDLYPAVARKYRAIPVLFRELRERFGVEARISGSGSGCFLLPQNDWDMEAIRTVIRECWGDGTFLELTRIL